VAILAWMALAIPATIDFRIPREMGTGQVVAYYLGAPLQLVRVLAHTVTDGNMLNSYVASFLGVFFDQPLTHRTYAWLAGLVALVILPCLASPRRLLQAALARSALVLTGVAGTLLAWKAEEGETVAEGQLVAVMEAMKMEMQVTAPCAGTLHRGASAGQVLAAAEVLGRIA